MILVNDKKLEHLTAIYHMALGLERRFPNNNGPFAYGTRLCEETGELAEALQVFDPLNNESKRHLIKEIEDVLQIIMGVLGIYDHANAIPGDITSYFISSKPSISKDTIIDLTVKAGLFADAINHMESQGIKQQKHGEISEKRLIEKGSDLIACIAQFIQYYTFLDEFERQIKSDYLRSVEKGFIDVY